MVIVIQCPDQIGLVAKISGLLAEEKFNILSMHEYVDKAENLFFMRLEVNKEAEDILLGQKLRELLPPNSLIKVNPNPVKKVIIMVTKEYHCLADILIRNYFVIKNANFIKEDYGDLKTFFDKFYSLFNDEIILKSK